VAALKFVSGAFGTIEGTTATWPGWSRRLEICGENGSVVMEDDDITRWDFRVAQSEDEKIRGMRESAAMGSGAAAPMNIKIEGHVRQIQDFIDGINGQRPFFIEGHEARKAVALVRAIYDSAATGRAIRPDGV
jgi:predicted dehydrogenase